MSPCSSSHPSERASIESKYGLVEGCPIVHQYYLFANIWMICIDRHEKITEKDTSHGQGRRRRRRRRHSPSLSQKNKVVEGWKHAQKDDKKKRAQVL